MTKDEYFKLCPTLVQEQVYDWVIASSFVCSWKPPRYGGRHILETELVYRPRYNMFFKQNKKKKAKSGFGHMQRYQPFDCSRRLLENKFAKVGQMFLCLDTCAHTHTNTPTHTHMHTYGKTQAAIRQTSLPTRTCTQPRTHVLIWQCTICSHTTVHYTTGRAELLCLKN